MDEPPRAVTAAAARAARESPGEGPEAAGAGRAMREEEERAAHWGEVELQAFVASCCLSGALGRA